MLVIKLKGPANIGNLQGPFEASILNRHTWKIYAERLDIMVKYFGSHTMPDDIIRSQVEEFKEELSEQYPESTVKGILTASRSFYTWMLVKGFAATNPFKTLKHKPYKDVQVIA